MTKRFGDFTAVHDVLLTVDKGQVLALPGPSGCGKTTTLRMVCGFGEPNEGSIFIAGQGRASGPASVMSASCSRIMRCFRT